MGMFGKVSDCRGIFIGRDDWNADDTGGADEHGLMLLAQHMLRGKYKSKSFVEIAEIDTRIKVDLLFFGTKN